MFEKFNELKKSLENALAEKVKDYPDIKSLLNNPFSKEETSETISETKVGLEKMKDMSHEEFFDIKFENRLSFVTKWAVKFDDIKSGKQKDLEFKFSFDWKINEDLLEHITLWQILPKEVSEVTLSWKKYFRSGFEWEFFSENGEVLTILDKTKIEISKLRTSDEMKKISENNLKLYTEFFEKYGEYKNAEYFSIVRESIESGLNFDEILIILTSSYDKIPLLGIESWRKMLNTIKSLKNQGLLDWTDAKESIEDIMIVMDLIKKYWSKDLKYNVSEKEENWKKSKSLQFDEKSIENEPKSLQKFIDIALSQVWIHERTWAANKYFSEAWFWRISAAKVPWCAAFINWVLMKAWYPWTKSLAAKSFIKWAWLGHVWIKVWDKMVSWNYWNKVAISKLPSWIIGYAIPTESWLKIFKWKDFDRKNIPDWAIVVMWRTKKQKHYA